MNSTDQANDNPYHSPIECATKMKAPFRLFTRFRIFLGLIIVILAFVIVGLLLPSLQRVHEAIRRSDCLDNLTKISRAIQQYEADRGHLPPAYTVDTDGRKLHSWRVLILPYLGEERLYQSIDLQKPWDDPVNQQARQTAPAIYQCGYNQLEPAFTSYLANVASDKFFVPAGQTKSRSNLATRDEQEMIMVFEVNSEMAVEWMSPRDGDLKTIRRLIEVNNLPHLSAFQAILAEGQAIAIFLSSKNRESMIHRFVEDD